MSLMKGFSVALLLLIASLCGADSFDAHCAGVTLLQDKRIQKEIGITEQQRTKMNKFADENRAKMEAYQKSLAGRPPDMKVLTGYMEELKRKVQSVMSPAQIKRLRELNLQAANTLALLDHTVAMKVGMSESQYKQFTKLYGDGQREAQKLAAAQLLPINKKYEKLAAVYKGQEQQHQKELQALSQKYREEATAAAKRIQPKVAAISKQTEKQMIALLSAKQKATWEALKGKKFTPKKTP